MVMLVMGVVRRTLMNNLAEELREDGNHLACYIAGLGVTVHSLDESFDDLVFSAPIT